MHLIINANKTEMDKNKRKSLKTTKRISKGDTNRN